MSTSSSSSSTRRCTQFSIKEIKAATNEFDCSKILGQGGEAKVYYGEMYIDLNKTQVAIKHMKGNTKTLVGDKHLKNNSEEFEREINTLSKIQHPNLVSLIGYCHESDHKVLVYEYMSKGCLSDYLKNNSRISLSWLQRLNICLGAARGLQHLHTETDEFSKGIIHRDVKPGNILLGRNWVGKVSDFGMFKLSNSGQEKSSMSTYNLKGTSGYYAPEYIKNHHITRKIDVYAFGVVLFQVLCCKMPWDREDESYYADEDEDLGVWAKENVDAQIQGEFVGDSLNVFADIIQRSLQMNPGKRPTMDDVVLDLQKALECQQSEHLGKHLVRSVAFLPRPFRGFEELNSSVHVHTLEEVSRHNKIDDFWIIISGKVYDLTPFMDEHPGGDEVLLSSEIDATQNFEDIGHSDVAIRLMESYYVGKVKVYTFEEVSKHNNINDCWIIISGKVYDVTPFMDEHPGGDDVFLSEDKDVTIIFEDVPHSDNARMMMESYYVGDVYVKSYSIASLQQYTNGFSHENFIGVGMLGSVYRAQLPAGKMLAVKMLEIDLKDDEYTELVNSLDKIRHANVVELKGYCSDYGERLLIYEYFSNGTLEDALHSFDDKYKKIISWNTRIKIALGAARALEYLHEYCEPAIIHRDLKSANLLLDDELAVHVSDCGLAPLLPSDLVTQWSGDYLKSQGYGAPEFESGIYTSMSDVYSFGVVMLELLTGRMSCDWTQKQGEEVLVRWAIPQLHDKYALLRMVDPSLHGEYRVKSLSNFADIISRCVQMEPERRPSMSGVVQDLIQLIRVDSSSMSDGD